VREGSSQLQSTQMVSVQRDGITPSLCRSVARFVAATSAFGASATSRSGASNDRLKADNGHPLQPTTTAVHAPFETFAPFQTEGRHGVESGHSFGFRRPNGDLRRGD
jgi:hypothetical protein